MSLTHICAEQALAQLAQYDTIVDARSESEYRLDHLPGAVNYPTLNDFERARVGTIYRQVSAFEAKRVGASYAAHNIANTIGQHLADKPRQWQPLLYCWRGGKRSGALALVLDQIGFNVHLLQGGYKAFRAAMLQDLQRLAACLDYRVICAPTGCGKTRLLRALAQMGAQVLDLEALAQHRSSVLGLTPGQVQPSQKHFDMLVWHTLRQFDPDIPVFVESESKKVGNVCIDESLIAAMRASPCIRIDLPLSHRVCLLLQDYDFFVQDPALFSQRLQALVPLRGRAVVARWQDYVQEAKWHEVVQELLQLHYDPSYLGSISRNFVQHRTAPLFELESHHMRAFVQLAHVLQAQAKNTAPKRHRELSRLGTLPKTDSATEAAP